MSEWELPTLEQDLEDAGKAGADAITARTNFEAKANYLQPGTPAQLAQLALAATPPSERLAKSGYGKDHATKHFVKKSDIPLL